MKLSCLQENLADGLAVVTRVVPARSTLPVVSNVLLSCEQARLKLAATNLEVAITKWIGAKIEEEGAITVPARLLADFVNSLGPDKIDLALNTKTRTLYLKCQRYEANIKGIDAEEFPPIPKPAEGPTTTINAEALQEGIQQVVLAAATDDTRPVLAGVLCSFEGKTLTLAAADGFRLAVRRLELDEPVEQKAEVIIPARALSELARILEGQEEKVEITVTPGRGQVFFSLADTELVSRLIEGTFPNYQQIIPTKHETRVTLERNEFLKATKIASLFARGAANIVKVNIVPGDDLTPGRFEVTASGGELGDNLSEMDAIVEGGTLQIAFNAKYLSDVLGVITTPKVVLEVTSPSSPGVVRPMDDGSSASGGSYVHVIMPMHTTR